MSNHSAAPDGTRGAAPLLASELAAAGASAAVMPGWHIYADFTPPELAAERRLRAIRFGVVVAVVIIAAAAFVGYDFARGEAAYAADSVTAEEAIGQALRSQQQQYSDVTSLRGTIEQARTELATLMAGDVDVDALVGKIWAALPDGMTISQLSLTLQDQLGKSPVANGGAAALDTSESVHIGTVTLTGTGTALDDVPTFIDNLAAVDGVYSPYPTSNAATDDGTTSYSLQFTVTDALLTGLYAVEGEN